MAKRIDKEDIKKMLLDKGFELLSDYTNNKTKMKFRDMEGYYYSSSLDSLRIGKYSPRKFDKSNSFTIQNIKLYCKDKPFEIISNTYNGDRYKLEIRCTKEECNEIFYMPWIKIHQGQGCPYCVGQNVGKSNSLAVMFPEVAKEWHPLLNGYLTPNDFTKFSGIEVWWKCANPLHDPWRARIVKRTQRGDICPYCSGRVASKDNNLLLNNPELALEWCYDKNKKHPDEYTSGSEARVWWKCEKCYHNWKAVIYSRANGSGCPNCKASKGEERIKSYLRSKIIQSEFQKKFRGLTGVGGGSLTYDFYLPVHNLLIEYQGGFHDGTVSYQTEKEFKIQQEHDFRKRNYAKDNGIKLLEIWYWDFDNIENILNEMIS